MEEESWERTSSFLHGADLLREHSNGKLPDGRASSAGEAGGAAASAWDVFPGEGLCCVGIFLATGLQCTFCWGKGCSALPASCLPSLHLLVWVANTLGCTAASAWSGTVKPRVPLLS